MQESADSFPSRPPIADVLSRHTSSLMATAGVNGTGEGREGGEPVFVIYVVRKTPELERALPQSLEGYRVQIREAGEVTAPPR